MVDRQVFSTALAPTQVLNDHKYVTSTHLIGGAIVSIVLLFVGGWSCFCFKRKLSGNLRLFGNKTGKLNAEKMELRRFHFEELQKATNNFSHDCLIGSGASGNVYRGEFDSGPPLAIKKPHDESCTSTEEFRNEVRLLSNAKHNNLVGLVGFCEETGTKGAKILVYEYAPNGSLLDYITGRGGRSLTWKERVKIAIGAAKGIAYLHEEINPSIIHRDIKPSNILIGEGFEAKVSDFGLVRSGPVGDQSHVSSLVKGSPGYLDPAYCSTLHLSPFTDVFSFGVILLQLVAARPVFESTKAHANTHIIDWARPSIEKGRIEEILDADLQTGGCNADVMLKMGELGLQCVVEEPRKRPTMARVWQELEATLESPPRRNRRPNQPTSHMNQFSKVDYDVSQSIVSIDGTGLQKFHVDMDSFSFQSASLRCLETSISMDFENFSLA